MSIAEKSKAASQSGVMPLTTALGYYGIAWAALIVGMVAASLAKWPLLFFIGYIGAGVFLNRTVLRNLIQWHPMYNTLDNVFKAKVIHVIFWPLSYLSLIVKIAVVRAI
ncbi:hypothetical protein [Caballeronia sp. EK]|uniref:hypothetical protein n=1 Tax=Caballeronia sp. EK TaxID=2767469 RepID=UPI002105BC52|nr:hypothetical protein [Caballeronia sp. EK]